MYKGEKHLERWLIAFSVSYELEGRGLLGKGRNTEGLNRASLSCRNESKVQRRASVVPQAMRGKPSLKYCVSYVEILITLLEIDLFVVRILLEK